MKLTQNNIDTINACRYCPMCRQACPSEFINYKESDAPRGRAILLSNVFNAGKEYEESTIESVYNCFLCGACKSWCSGHELGGYDIPELIKFARRDIVSKGLAPKVVTEIKDSLIEKDHTGKIDKASSYTASIEEKSANVLYILGEGVNFKNHKIAKVAETVFNKCGIQFTMLKEEPTSGKTLDLLGFREEAKGKAKAMYERIKATGCKTIVVSDPLVYDALKNDYLEWGFDLSCDILHTSEYLLSHINSGNVKLNNVTQKVTLADSEFLGRNNDVYEAPRLILQTIADEGFIEMQWKREYLQSAGEAAFVFNREAFLRGSELGKKISKKAEEAGAEVIVTLSATAKENISATTDLKVQDIVEYVSGLVV